MSAIALLETHKEALKELIPKGVSGYLVEDVIRQVDACIVDNYKLKNCSDESIARAARYALQLGLNIHGPLRQAALIPYGSECKFELQYQGLHELIMRTGLYKKIVSKVVREKDNYCNSNDSIDHSYNSFGDRGEVVGFYATAKHINGESFTEEFSDEEVTQLELDTRKKDKDGKLYNMSPAWKNWRNEMGRKAVLKRLCKHVPKTGAQHIETLNEAIRIDNEQFEPEIIEPKSLEEGRKQKQEMEEGRAREEALRKLAMLEQEAEVRLDSELYKKALSLVRKSTLAECLDSIDLLTSMVNE